MTSLETENDYFWKNDNNWPHFYSEFSITGGGGGGGRIKLIMHFSFPLVSTYKDDHAMT